LLPLLERGCAVMGIDPSATGLTIAKRYLNDRGLRACLVEGFFEDVPIAQTFDAVIFSYYSYAAIPMRRRRIEALRKAASLLKPGGHVVVSYAAPGVRPRPALVRLAQMSAALTRSDWRLEPGDVVSDNRDQLPSYSFVHIFSTGEVELEASAADLQVVYDRRSGDNTVVITLCRR
jgi:SAM-dependent methyltransferase